MAVKVNTAAVERELKSFPDQLKARLRQDLQGVASTLETQARADFQRSTVDRTGETVRSIRKSVSVSNNKARVRITFAQPKEFFAAWLTYGLAPRPWHERAVSRRGYVSRRIGKAKVHKPWGIRARGFAQATQRSAGPLLAATAGSTIAAAVADFNKASR